MYAYAVHFAGLFLTFPLFSVCVLKSSSKSHDMNYWVRDPKFETDTTTKSTSTLSRNVILEQVINDVGSNKMGKVLEGLKAIRRSGFSIDGLLGDIEKMDMDIKNMNYHNEVEEKLKRKSLTGSDSIEDFYDMAVSNVETKNKKLNHDEKDTVEPNRKNKKGINNIDKKHSIKGHQKIAKVKPVKSNTISTDNTTYQINITKEIQHTKQQSPLREHRAQKAAKKTQTENDENSKGSTNKFGTTPKKKQYVTFEHENFNSKTIADKSFSKDEYKLKRQQIYEHGKELLRKGREHSWPKVKPKKHHIGNKGPVRVTQMDPLLLRDAKDNEKTENEDDKDDKKQSSLKLNPFSIKRQMLDLCVTKCAFPDTNISISTLGRTVEYNDIVMLKAMGKGDMKGRYLRTSDDKYAEEQPEKKIFFIVHGLTTMGINEIPCLSVMRKFQRLLSFYFEHLDKFDIFVVPMANPDGVAYLTTTGSKWNKNVSPQSACPGVTLDRNFDVAWNCSRSVSSCSQQYPGPMPFSEHETRAIRDVFHRYSHKIVAYLHVHAGAHDRDDSFKGDAVLYPRGYTEFQSDDDRYVDLRGELDEVMKNASFKMYSVGMDTLANWYGKVAGTSVDYASTVYGIPYAMELVMQPLENNLYIDDEDAREQNQVLEVVWRRVIDTIFKNIYRSQKGTSNKDQDMYRL